MARLIFSGLKLLHDRTGRTTSRRPLLPPIKRFGRWPDCSLRCRRPADRSPEDGRSFQCTGCLREHPGRMDPLWFGGPFQRRQKPVAEMVAYCGLTCQTCPIYLATRQKNKKEQAKMRAEIVKQCQEHYGITYKLEDITDCDGCKTEGERLFSASRNCLIRKCTRGKRLENCASCAEYACEKLTAFFKTDPIARKRLDAIRSSILQNDKKKY